VSCLFVARAYRRKGLSVALIRAAVRFAAGHGARIVEGYPVIPYSDSMPGPFAWTGTYAAFQAAGFTEAGRHSPKRPIMRTPARARGAGQRARQ
jgi:GNAT superfamily N-acetyltransferase